MKKIIFLTAFAFMASLNLFAFPGPDVPEKVKATFHKQYPNIQSAVFSVHADFYEAYFKKEDKISVRVYYDLKGKIDHTIMYYKESELNPFIKTKLDKDYKGKTIFGVTEYQSDHDHYYQIILQDNSHWYFVYFDRDQSYYGEKVYNKS